MSQPLPNVVATVWHFTTRGCLPLCGLPRVNLLEASLVHKEPLPPRGTDEWAWKPFPLDLEELLVLMRHACCVTLPREWPTAPHGYLNGKMV